MDKDNGIVYFEFNDWAPEYHPPVEPYISWICSSSEKKYYINFRDEQWIKENNLVIVESLVDMSLNYCVTARREWVEEHCPDLLTTYSEFLRTPEDDEDTPTGQWGCPFLEWTEENIGLHIAEEKEDNQGYLYYEVS